VRAAGSGKPRAEMFIVRVSITIMLAGYVDGDVSSGVILRSMMFRRNKGSIHQD
jgi:hypothetical protein